MEFQFHFLFWSLAGDHNPLHPYWCTSCDEARFNLPTNSKSEIRTQRQVDIILKEIVVHLLASMIFFFFSDYHLQQLMEPLFVVLTNSLNYKILREKKTVHTNSCSSSNFQFFWKKVVSRNINWSSINLNNYILNCQPFVNSFHDHPPRISMKKKRMITLSMKQVCDRTKKRIFLTPYSYPVFPCIILSHFDSKFNIFLTVLHQNMDILAINIIHSKTEIRRVQQWADLGTWS